MAIFDKGREKEEKNIRRRVYDAINVLISADVLRKEGKIVRLNITQKRTSSQIRAVQMQIQKGRRKMLKKRKILQEHVDRYIAMK